MAELIGVDFISAVGFFDGVVTVARMNDTITSDVRVRPTFFRVTPPLKKRENKLGLISPATRRKGEMKNRRINKTFIL